MRDDRTQELLASLKTEVESLTDSDQWKRWLETAARFHRYSFSNQLLILRQMPEATKVAGYRAWQELGRQVRKGEKGIWILAPMVKKVTEDDGTEHRTCYGFRSVSVFDLSQTEGEPLPTVELPEVSLSEDSWDLYNRFSKVADEEGLSIKRVDSASGSARGWYIASDKTISIVDAYPQASQTRTLLHELAHHFTPDLSKLSRPEAELIAESAAYVVGTQLGIDTTGYSALYTASWANGKAGELEKVAQQVVTTAHRLNEALGLEDK